MDDPVITESELFAEIDKIYNKNTTPKPLLTDRQFAAIEYARSKKPPMSWSQIKKMMEELGLGDLPETTLIGKYKREKERRA